MASNVNRPENLTREELERFAWDVLDLFYGTEYGDFVYDPDREVDGGDTVDGLCDLIHRFHLDQAAGDPPPRRDRRPRRRGGVFVADLAARGVRLFLVGDGLYAVRPGDADAEFLADLPPAPEAP